MKRPSFELMSFLLVTVLFVLLICSVSYTAHSQSKGKGEITGKITDQEDNSELPGATVLVRGTTIGSIANVNGQFTLSNVPLGTQILEFSFVGYAKTEVTVNVQEGVLITLNVKLKPSTLLDEIVITGTADVQYSPIRNSTDLQLINTMKFSEGVLAGISNEQIVKGIDRDASQIVQRIAGVSLVDRFVVVRGLDTRYNMTLINGLVGPSSEENSRAFSLDALPTGVIDRIEVEKSPGAHLPGMWGGGVIKIFTRSFTTTRAFNFDISGAYRSGGSSFVDDFVTYDGSSNDWIANGANDRRLPPIMRQQNFTYPSFNRYPLENIAIARSATFKTNIPKTTKHDFDKRMNFSYYDSWKIGSIRLNNLTAGSYSQERLFRVTERAFNAATYDIAVSGVEFNPITQTDSLYNSSGQLYYHRRPTEIGIDSLYEEQVRISAVQSIGVLINDNHNISLTGFYNRFGIDTFVNRQGNEIEDNPDLIFKSHTYRYEERDIVMGQLGGSHRLGMNSVEWTAGASLTTNDVPDLQRYRFQRLASEDASQWQVQYAANFDETYQVHYVFETEEASATGRLDYKRDFNNGIYLKAGIFYDSKERSFFSYQYGIFSNPERYITPSMTRPWFKLDSLNAPINFSTVGLHIVDRDDQGSYFFDDRSKEGYIAVNYPVINERLTIYGGVRVAQYNRVLYNSYNVPLETTINNYLGFKNFKIPDQETLYFLPSVMIKYSFLDGKYVARVVYGQSIDRPQFREQAPFTYYDPQSNTDFLGNPGLENSLVQSADLRLEHYPKSGEFLAVGLFYKHIDKPIQFFTEKADVDGSPNTHFSNATTAKLLGIELEVRKKFDFLSYPIIKNMSANVNASYIWSESKYDPIKTSLFSIGQIAEEKFFYGRLQGSSPILVNAALYYELLETGTLVSAIYNLTWDRTRDYGGDFETGDLTEGRRHQLDLVFKQRITKFLTLKMGVQDLLNQTQRFYRDQNSNYKYDPGINKAVPDDPKQPVVFRSDYIERSFKPGSYYSIGLSLNLQNNKPQ